ncbi:MAG: CBS domain-containing protein [Gallionellaceae bacterium]|nr:CBS domain-containing protein [Gallionellaceae bacterium]
MPLRAIALSSSPQIVAADTSVRVVLGLMLEQGVDHVALVDAGGRFVGLASVGVALERIIPFSARTPHGLNDLAFAGDALPMLLDHFRGILDQPATTLLDPRAETLHVATPLMEAALLLTHAQGPLPVLDDHDVLVGVLSQRALMRFLANQSGER